MRTRVRAKRHDWYTQSLDLLKAELDQAMEAGLEIPAEPGGWWHQYVCPKHHVELLFDPLVNEPEMYRCPYGCELRGEPYYSAWLVFKHQALARFALQAAAVYAGTGEAVYGELGRRIIVSYAEQFPKYPVHPDAQPWMLKGRAFHQALTEAIWSTTLLRAYLLLSDEGISLCAKETPIHQFLMLLEHSMKEYHHILTHDRGNPENNYTAWLNAALCCIYAIQGDREKLDQLIHSAGGIQHHLSIAINPDHLEFEGSIYYHVFVLRAYLIAVEMLQRFGIDGFSYQGHQGQHIEGMLDVLAGLADEQGVLPALHDGPYERIPFAREIAEVFEIGWTKFHKREYLGILMETNRVLGYEPGCIGSLEAVLYGTGERETRIDKIQKGSLLLPESGFAVLRHSDNPLSCLLDFGPHGGAHGHYDKLNMVLRHPQIPLSPDRGTVPYGSELKKGWYKETACHNTVSINGKSQLDSTGACKRYEDTDRNVYCWIRAAEAYEGAVLDRHVLVTDRWVLDWYLVELTETAQIDWWFHHCDQLVEGELQWETCPAELGQLDGYGYINALRRLNLDETTASIGCNGQADLLLNQSNVTLSLLVQPGTELMEVSSPGLAIDPSVPMHGLLLRSNAKSANIIAMYRAGYGRVELSYDAASQRLTVIDGIESWQYELTGNGLRELTAE
jgi:hypothetical protein